MTSQAGGRTRVTFDGQVRSPRSAPNIRFAQQVNQVFTNHDGTVSKGTMAKPAEADMTFDVGQGVSWRDSFMTDFHNVTIYEIDRKILHMFTNAIVVGEPVFNTETGEITGLSIATDSYSSTRA